MGRTNYSQHLLPICISRLVILAVYTKTAFSFQTNDYCILIESTRNSLRNKVVPGACEDAEFEAK